MAEIDREGSVNLRDGARNTDGASGDARLHDVQIVAANKLSHPIHVGQRSAWLREEFVACEKSPSPRWIGGPVILG
jgi:hypothetical protein